MAFAPLILRGNKTIEGVDVDDQVIALTFMGSRDTVRIPATFGTRSTVAGGDDTYQVKIDYLQDVDTTAISQVFWDALADADGTVEVSGTVREGAVSATNPLYTATALVSGVELGGKVNDVATDSQTFDLTGRPAKTPAP